MATSLPPLPANLADANGHLVTGLWAGRVGGDPVRSVRQRGGRVRRWSYAAAGDEAVQVGAAVVDVGFGANAFVWCCAERQVWTWERTVIGGRGVTVPTHPAASGSALVDDASLAIGPRGELRIDVPVAGIGEVQGAGRLTADISTDVATPAVCATGTAGGGWNVTQKTAGYDARGTVTLGRRRWDLQGGGWSDWTAGRQDRRTVWRWAAGAGATGGHAVGFNVSTGMNAAADGEDVVWWDRVPYSLELTSLEPVDATDGPWRLTGPGWDLHFEPAAVRSADENLWLVRSRYVQPIGRFVGTLPGPDGDAVPIDIVGVTEDHHARW